MSTDSLRELVQQVLAKGYLMSLATADDSGLWVADVIYIFDENLNLYWMSDPDVRHSQAVAKNTQVAGTITVSQAGEDNLGIQFHGQAEKIDGNRHDLAVKHFQKRNKPAPSEEDDVLQGDSWYMLRPTSFDLIHESLFGFDKKTLKL